MVEQSKIDKVLDILTDRGLIEYATWRYKFTPEGRAFVSRKRNTSWPNMTSSTGSLWVPTIEDAHKTWRFKSSEQMEPSEFNDFCDFFEINLGPALYDIDDEFDYI